MDLLPEDIKLLEETKQLSSIDEPKVPTTSKPYNYGEVKILPHQIHSSIHSTGLRVSRSGKILPAKATDNSVDNFRDHSAHADR